MHMLQKTNESDCPERRKQGKLSGIKAIKDRIEILRVILMYKN